MKKFIEKTKESFRWYFDEQFPGPFVDIYMDDMGPVVVFEDQEMEQVAPVRNYSSVATDERDAETR